MDSSQTYASDYTSSGQHPPMDLFHVPLPISRSDVPYTFCIVGPYPQCG
jgi:hypothetical protein